MMISAAPTEASQTPSSSQTVICSQKREQKGLPIEIRRMVGLETAFQILGGKGELAGVLGITVRALNYKLNADRGVSNLDLTWTAKALEARGNKMLEHASKLRAVLAEGTGKPATAILLESTKIVAEPL